MAKDALLSIYIKRGEEDIEGLGLCNSRGLDLPELPMSNQMIGRVPLEKSSIDYKTNCVAPCLSSTKGWSIWKDLFLGGSSLRQHLGEVSIAGNKKLRGWFRKQD
ncbi:hypothetical protein IFM89_018680 [Coptis chinensis]|uniref:Uncharacterized protein n=1 Tax=Coptis chinensis TaxID=261450 RepID=A0A835IC45_9MAGN|nr:hypothetical protein IFM89_018680 [Coptis chinensis]